jgi:hypothetical protein
MSTKQQELFKNNLFEIETGQEYLLLDLAEIVGLSVMPARDKTSLLVLYRSGAQITAYLSGDFLLLEEMVDDLRATILRHRQNGR